MRVGIKEARHDDVVGGFNRLISVKISGDGPNGLDSSLRNHDVGAT